MTWVLCFCDNCHLYKNPVIFLQDKFTKMLQGILPMWDGAQTGRADAGNLEAS
jgi:hypothetical protein